MSAPESERFARVALSRVVEPGHVRMLELVSELGATAVHEGLARRGRRRRRARPPSLQSASRR